MGKDLLVGAKRCGRVSTLIYSPNLHGGGWYQGINSRRMASRIVKAQNKRAHKDSKTCEAKRSASGTLASI